MEVSCLDSLRIYGSRFTEVGVLLSAQLVLVFTYRWVQSMIDGLPPIKLAFTVEIPTTSWMKWYYIESPRQR